MSSFEVPANSNEITAGPSELEVVVDSPSVDSRLPGLQCYYHVGCAISDAILRKKTPYRASTAVHGHR